MPKLVVALSLNLWFIAALLLYAALSVIWVWILSDTPLSIAYPFVALAFVLTPLLGHFAFGEALGWSHAAGLALVVGGLLLVLK
ncbi:MAG TPA: EamA family transporter [Acetobacteraceae bacterium]|nr:EamA family transporter [Acetobacteraceae bacterium]